MAVSFQIFQTSYSVTNTFECQFYDICHQQETQPFVELKITSWINRVRKSYSIHKSTRNIYLFSIQKYKQ